MRSSGDWLGALARIEQALAESPDDRELYRLRVLTLADVGASHRAWTLFRARPEWFDSAERMRFETAQVARLINWSRLYAANEQDRLAEAEAAAARIREFRSAAPGDAHASSNLDFDELILLNRLARHEEVVRRYRGMLAQGRDVPSYVLAAVGDSLLAERAPEQAAVALAAAAEHAPDNHDATLQLAYAHVESERFGEALALLERTLEQQPAWPRPHGAPRGHENRFRLDAEVTYALVRAFDEDLAGAQATLEPLGAAAPSNAELQSSLGTVYLFRGWPEAALQRFSIAATLDERHVPAMLGQVAALSALDRFDEARPIRARLVEFYGSEVNVQDMERRWRVARGAGVRAYAAAGDGRGDAGVSPLGSRDVAAGVEAHSALLADKWRVLLRSEHRRADFADQRGRLHRNDIGVQYAYRGLNAAALVGRATDGLGGTGATATLSTRLDDHWTVGAELRRNDAGASLQARAAGITADSARVNASYRRHESAAISFGASRFRYDDGNRVDAVDVSASRRWISEPHLTVAGLVDFDASRASRDDAPYFNPARAATLGFGIDVDRIAWRRYERHFRHRLAASAGVQWQDGFGTAWVPALRYGHEWQFAPARGLEYGLSWSRPVYDGQRETHVALDIELRWGE
ncbi:poly-beta-1,6 N-acetyl-D-glucosamine export porin PgaA [Lysobacter korlensis]|uniref:Poly-beta-1,6 N-acetyl-D-glucosamine export porin PgaA n=1 Tax=Lysobacter korlensis TaxID=553636 RepID=A0ABV6RLJ5_9GAMM